MAFNPINTRQIINSAALPNIGAPAGDGLDDILLRIDNDIGGGGSSSYVAKKMALTSNATSIVVTIPAQPDTSYIVLAMMGNVTDALPQYQQVEVTAKSTSGFTFKWNHPLDSNNYFISFIIPFKSIPEVEASIGSGMNILSSTLPMPQPWSGYGVIAQLQNTVDTNPQFQTVVVAANSSTSVNLDWNDNTDSVNYQAVYMIQPTGQVSIPNGASSVTINLPVNFNTSSYAIVATIQNTVDAFPQYQPLLITAQSGASATIGMNNLTDASTYLLNYYAISLTA